MADNTPHEEINHHHVWSRRSSSDDSDKPVEPLSEVQELFQFKPEPVDLSLTMETLATKHQELTKEWRASSTYRTCLEAIKATVLQQKKLNIDRCICLGLGSFTCNPYMFADNLKKTVYSDRRDMSFSQLVVFEGWIEQLSESFLSTSTQNEADDLAEEKYPIANIYFQDPAFTPLDEAYIRSKGYSILHTPDSNTLINDTTMLFTPREQPEVLEATLAVAFPGLYISQELSLSRDYHRPPGTSWVEGDKEQWLPRSSFKRQRKLFNSFLVQRATRHLPCYDDPPDWWYNMVLYYTPDSENNIEPRTLKPEGKVYTYDEALEVWRGKGVISELVYALQKYQRNLIRLHHCRGIANESEIAEGCEGVNEAGNLEEFDGATAALRACNEFLAWVEAETDIKLDKEAALPYLRFLEGEWDDESSDVNEETKEEQEKVLGEGQ